MPPSMMMNKLSLFWCLALVLCQAPLLLVTAQHGGHGGHGGNHSSSGNGTAICPTGERLDLDERYPNEMMALMASNACNCTGTMDKKVHNHGGSEFMVGHPHYCCGPYVVFTNEADATRSAFACGINGVHEHHPGMWMLGRVHGCGPLEFFGIDATACLLDSPAQRVTFDVLAAALCAILAVSLNGR